MFAFIIDKDHVSSGCEDKLRGSATLNHYCVARLKLGEGEAFRLYDDDGNLYYEGRIAGTYNGFEPLDWAMPYAGCTTIQYRHGRNGRWKVL